MLRLRNRLGFATFLLGLLLLALGPIFGVWSWLTVRQVREGVEHEERARLLALVQTLAPRVPGEAHEAVWQAAPEYDAVLDWQSSPEGVQELRQAMEEAYISNHLESPIYTLRLREESRAAVEAAPDHVHAGALEFVLTTNPTPYWGHRLDYLPSMGPTLLEGQARSSPIYTDAHGRWVSAFAPLFDREGNVVAMLEADLPVDVLLARATARMRPFLYTFGALIALTICGLFLVARAVSADLRHLSRAATRIGKGDYGTPVRVDLTGRELVELAVALEHSREQIGLDISRREELGRQEARAREAAEEASEAKTRFLTNISHEIRTPLNGLIGLTGLLGDTELNANQKRMVETMHGAGGMLLRVLDDVLHISEQNETELHLVARPFELESTVRGVAQLFESHAREKGLQLVCEVEEGLPTHVSGDEARLRQVLSNLLGNAVKFTDEGSVSIIAKACSQSPACTYFEVRDTGPGIPEEMLAHIFQAFTQLDDSTSRRHGGTGLGLAICAEIVKRMGGTLEHTTPEGGGSAFHFSIALERVEEKPKVYTPRARPSREELVLVVEDNPVNQVVTKRQVEKLGYRCAIAKNGRVALKTLDGESEIAAILMDGQMPEMDGYEATRAIRARNDAYRAVPIIGLSAHAMEKHRKMAFDCGMDEYLTKPVLLETLGEALRCATSGDEVGQAA